RTRRQEGYGSNKKSCRTFGAVDRSLADEARQSGTTARHRGIRDQRYRHGPGAPWHWQDSHDRQSHRTSLGQASKNPRDESRLKSLASRQGASGTQPEATVRECASWGRRQFERTRRIISGTINYLAKSSA